MSTYFSGADTGTYPGYYGPGGSVTVGASAELLGVAYGISMAGAGTVDNLGTAEGGSVGIDLAGGGTITNGSTDDPAALIVGDHAGISLGGAGIISNFGEVESTYTIQVSSTPHASYSIGIELASSGTIFNGGTNDYSASINAEGYGIDLLQGGTVINLGAIAGSGVPDSSFSNRSPFGIGVGSADGQLVLKNGNVNDNATIFGGSYGVDSNDALISNYGKIKGLAEGIYIKDVAKIYNFGYIIGGLNGIFSASGDLSIYNAGIISGYHSGKYIYDTDGIQFGDLNYTSAGADFVRNSYNGTIYGGIEGIYSGTSDVTTVINYGTIEPGNSVAQSIDFFFAVQFENAADLFVVEGGSKMVGLAIGGGGTLELGAGGGPGTLSGLGSESEYSGYTNFSTYLVQAGSDWTVDGTNTVSGIITLSADSSFFVNGTLAVDNLVGNVCDIGINSGGTLSLNGYASIESSESLTNNGMVKVTDALVVAGSIGGDGTIEISAGATLDLPGGIAGTIAFEGHQGILDVADPVGVTFAISNFAVGDVIDLTSVAYSSAEVISYKAGRVSVMDGTTTVAAFTFSDEPAGSVFAVQPDGEHGTDLVVEPSASNSYLSTGVLQASQVTLLNEGLQALSSYVAQSDGIGHAGLNFFTPPSLYLRQRIDKTIAGDVNIANGYPVEDTIQLGADVQGVVFAGINEAVATLVGHSGAAELLVGNDQNDTIRAGGGSGTVISGDGRNEIYTGSGDVVVSSGGDDTIYSGKSGIVQITSLGNATVHGGGGFISFIDSGTDNSIHKVKGGSGTTVMNSGLGQDTFVGGSGTSFMNDTGSGRVTLVFNKGTGGTDIVTGFDPSNGDYIRTSVASNGWADFQNNISVVGGSSFVHLADGTKIEFVGFTSLSEADFHA